MQINNSFFLLSTCILVVNQVTFTASKGHGATSCDLESDFAKISVGGAGTTKATLGNIENLYGTWDDNKVIDGADAGRHSGVGFWWDGTQIDGGDQVSVGSVTYGPIELKKIHTL